jgi:hypothetical protein
MTSTDLTTHADVSGNYRRIIRRETHSSRAGLAITLSIVLILALAYVGTEAVLAALGLPPLLAAPASAWSTILGLPASVDPALLITAGVVAAIIGLLLVIAAVSPGRRLDHVTASDRAAVVIDNRAIASALARRAAHAADLDPDQVVVSVGRSVADIRVQPSSGWPVDREVIDAAVAAEIDRLELTPPLRHRLIIESKGVVGA